MGFKATIETVVKPMRFFPQLKGIVGYRKNEIYNVPSLIELVKEKKDFFPCEVDEKYDGFRVQIHKKDNACKIWSEDGGDVTHRFPSLCSEVLKANDKDFVLDAEITGWTGKGFRIGKHIGRSDTSGYAHKKDTPDDSQFFANVFDIVYFGDKSINSQPLKYRRWVLTEQIKPSVHLLPIDFKVAENIDEMVKSVEYFKRRAGSEGAMLKSLKSNYPLSGQTGEWIKFKNEVDLDAEIISKYKVKGSEKTFNYLCAIRDTAGRLVPIGNSYNTNIDIDVGGILRVAFVNLNRYTDPKSGQVWFNWWSPRPIEHREDKTIPDNTITANRVVIATKGENEKKPFPPRYIRAIKDYEHGSYEVQDWSCPCGTCPCTFLSSDYQDVFLEYPEPDKNLKFVIQAHIRGRSVHIDDRRQLDDENSVGMTHFVPKALSREPTSFEDAKQLYYDEIHPLVKEMLNDPQQKFLSGQKSLVPNEWLDVEGKIDKNEPGSTRFKPGYMIVLDTGNIEYGSLKPYYHEYWYYGKLLNGKYIDRLIENQKDWKKVDDELSSWLFFKSEAIPYVISPRSIETDFIPPYGISALPKSIEDKIPNDFKYWTIKNTSARTTLRNDLIEAIRKKEVTFENIKSKFSYSRQDWKGQMVSRLGPTKQIYHLSIDFPKKPGVEHFFVYSDLIQSEVVSMLFRPTTSKKIMTLKGAITPQTPWNLTKDTPSTIEMIDENKIVIIEKWDDDEVIVRFDGEKLKGKWQFKKEDANSNLWSGKKIYEFDVKSIKLTESINVDIISFETNIDIINSSVPFLNDSYLSNNDSENKLPSFVEISGVLFYPGIHTSSQGIKRHYTAERLKNAKLTAPKNYNLAYVNWYHIKDEPFRAGILTDVWWDPDSSIEGADEKGCLRYRAIVFHRDAVAEIHNKATKNVSAELNFEMEGKDNEGVPIPKDIKVTGMAITSAPALKNANIGQVCTTSCDGKRTCKQLN